MVAISKLKVTVELLEALEQDFYSGIYVGFGTDEVAEDVADRVNKAGGLAFVKNATVFIDLIPQPRSDPSQAVQSERE